MQNRLFLGCFDSALVRYGSHMVGYGVLGLPIFGPNKEKYLELVIKYN